MNFLNLVFVPLYYGFYTAVSVGPSYLFVFRAHISAETEELTLCRVSTTAGCLTGQLIMFISIYYPPFHLALGRPHTITFIIVPYLFFHVVSHFFDYPVFTNRLDSRYIFGNRKRNSIRSLGIQRLFLNNFIFQLFNHFIFPSSMFNRLVNIYMFRCNSKMLFVTSSFIGWVIGQILFLKSFEFLLVWIRQNRFIRSNVFIRSNKYIRYIRYLVFEFTDSNAIFFIVLFSSLFYYLGRMTPPILTQKTTSQSQIAQKVQENDIDGQESHVDGEDRGAGESDLERQESDVEIEGATEEDPFPFSFPVSENGVDKIFETEEIEVNGKEKRKDPFDFSERFENNRPFDDIYGNQENWKVQIKEEEIKPHVTVLFDYKRWKRPLRYLNKVEVENNNHFIASLRTEASQYYFDIAESDGKERISFTYPPSLAKFGELIARRFGIVEKKSPDEVYAEWISNNKEKFRNLNEEFIHRIEALEKVNILETNILETKTRLCTAQTKNETDCLARIYDPFLAGMSRGRMNHFSLSSIRQGNELTNPSSESSIEKEVDEEEKYEQIYLIFDDSCMVQFENYAKLFGFQNDIEFEQKLKEEHQKLIEEKEEEKQQKGDSKKNLIDLNELNPGFKEIRKETPVWPYKLVDEMEIMVEALEDVTHPLSRPYAEIKTIRRECVMIYHKKIESIADKKKEMVTTDPTVIRGEDEKPVTVTGDTTEKKLETTKKDKSKKEEKKKEMESESEQEVKERKRAKVEEPSDLFQYIIEFGLQPDDNFHLIYGSMRALRRKTPHWIPIQRYSRSALFLEKLEEFTLQNVYFHMSELMMFFLKKGLVLQNVFLKNIKRIVPSKRGKAPIYRSKKKGTKLKKRKTRATIATTPTIEPRSPIERDPDLALGIQFWDNLDDGQAIRGCLLLFFSFFRKKIFLPVLIISKNIARCLLFQVPEWSEDFKDLANEDHVKCTYWGTSLPNNEFPENWLEEGMQIQIINPFRLKPWKEKNTIPEADSDYLEYCYLTALGFEADFPFGRPRPIPSFFKPIFKQLYVNFNLLVRIVLKEIKEKEKLKKFVKQVSEKVSENVSNGVIQKAKDVIHKSKDLSENSPFVRVINELKKKNILFFPRKIHESSETQMEKDSLISNQISYEPLSQMQYQNDSLIEEKIKNTIDRTNTIQNQIKKIEKEKKKVTSEINKSTKNTNNPNPNKNVELAQGIWQIVKKKNIQLQVKFHFFIKVCIEKVYIDIFLSIINMPRIPLKHFFESTKKRIDKYNEIDFISTIKNIKTDAYNLQNNKKKSAVFFDFSYLSQAYVFFKLSQIQINNFPQVINLSKLRSILQSNESSSFIKTEIKDFFRSQGLFHSELKENKLPNLGMNEWKKWFRGLRSYQYDVSRIIRSTKKPKNGINQCHRSKNKGFRNGDCYEKNQFKTKKRKVYSLSNKFSNKKYKVQKNYRYDLFCYNYIQFETKKNSYYRSALKTYRNQEVNKEKVLKVLKNFSNPNQNDIKDIEKKMMDRKILCFNDISLKWNKFKRILQKVDKLHYKKNTNFDFDENDPFYLPIPFWFQNLEKQNPYPYKEGWSFYEDMFELVLNTCETYPWGQMNELLVLPLSSASKNSFFPEFVISTRKYKNRPFFLPTKFLLLNLNIDINKKFSENDKIKKKPNDKINEKPEVDFLSFRPSNAMEYFPSVKVPQTRNKEDFFGFKTKRRFKTKSEGKEQSVTEDSKKEAEAKEESVIAEVTEQSRDYLKWTSMFLDPYFIYQLNIPSTLEEYFMKLRLFLRMATKKKNLDRKILSYIKYEDWTPSMAIYKETSTFTDRVKRGIVNLDVVRLSVKNDGQFFMYQIIGISLAHKRKDQSNQRYRDKKNVNNKKFYEPIVRYQRKTLNKDKTYYNLLVPENILSSRRRREFRILTAFNLNDMHPVFCKENKIKNWSQFLNVNESQDFYRKKNELIKLKFFLWPNFRLEDLACMNRYWFDTNNGSRSSMLRLYMYPLF